MIAFPNSQEEITLIFVYGLAKTGVHASFCYFLSAFATSCQPYQAVRQVLQLKEEALEWRFLVRQDNSLFLNDTITKKTWFSAFVTTVIIYNNNTVI